MIRGLIFDFDGLILDTELPDYESWKEIYEAHGGALPFSAWSECIGATKFSFDPFDSLASQVATPLDREAIREQRRRRYTEMIEAQAVLPGVEAAIADAQRLGLKIGLASSSRRDWVAGHLTRLGLHVHFDTIRTADDVTHTKPHPELYLTALDALGLQPKEAIAIEDSPVGIRAANNAGIFCVAIPNALTSQLPLDHADLRLASLAELPLEKLLARVEETRR